jgi:hypothetical protein
MKTVAAYPFRRQIARQSVRSRDIGLVVVKRGIETRDLREMRRRIRYRTNGRDIVRLMQRREGDQRIEIGKHLLVDQDGLGVRNPTMDDAMSGAIESGFAAEVGREPKVDGGERGVVIVATGRSTSC